MFDTALRAALQKLLKAQERGLLEKFGLIGGLATARWGYARATADIDWVISLSAENRSKLAEELRGELSIGDVRDPLLSAITFEERVDDFVVPVQLVQFPRSWEEAAFEGLEQTEFDNYQLPIVNWSGLVLLKLYAGSPLDLEDARRIIDAVKPGAQEFARLKRRASALRVNRKLARLLL